jgi:hypothetical protein
MGTTTKTTESFQIRRVAEALYSMADEIHVAAEAAGADTADAKIVSLVTARIGRRARDLADQLHDLGVTMGLNGRKGAR